MASNAGSVATITGNPQNMIIGSLSHIPYGTFVATLAPVAAVGLVLTVVLIAAHLSAGVLHPRAARFAESLPDRRYHPALVYKSVFVTAAVIVLFFAGQPVAKVAILGGALLLFTRRVKAEKVYFDIDWPLLVMFVGLFIVVAGLEKAVLTPDVHRRRRPARSRDVPVLAGITAVLSNLVSNVPAVLVLKPFIDRSRRPGARLAGRRHGLDPCRQLHHRRLGRQPHRRRARPLARRRSSASGTISSSARR